jgi:hypothetical protein
VIASDEADIARFIREHYSDALAVEMEGRGFLEALHMNAEVDGVVVRAISDQLSGKKETDAGGWQPVAAENAAALAFEILATHVWPGDSESLAEGEGSSQAKLPKSGAFARNVTVESLLKNVVPGEVKLRSSDLALARITAKWHGALKTFQDFERQCAKAGFDLDLGIHLRNMIAFATGQSRFLTVGNLSIERLQQAWKECVPGMEFALNFLKSNAGSRLRGPSTCSPGCRESSIEPSPKEAAQA